VLVPAMVGLSLTPGSAAAQTVQQRLDTTAVYLQAVQGVSAKLPAPAKNRMSSSAQYLLRMAADWTQIGPQLARSATTLSSSVNGKPFSPGGSLSPGTVSDPSTDVAFSRLAGFVQSETSTAWCGNTVVVVFNDSGSYFETYPVPAIGLSFNGYARSTDGGATFTDLGYLNPGANIFNFLEGDPVVTCTDQNTFYQSSILETVSSSFAPLTGASVSRSTDGGQTFTDPVAVVLKDAYTHFIDKPWMAVDHSNPNKLYATYTDIDISGFFDPNAPCPGNVREGIELVASADGGATWSAPTVIDTGCYPFEDQGSNVAVDGMGNVLVAWEQFPAVLPTNEIDIVKSTNGGATFGPKTAVATVTPVGHTFFGLLQGGFRNNEFPSLAIDRWHGHGTKTLYIAWNDGRNGTVPDNYPPFFGSSYHFGDAFVSHSNDGGVTWSPAVKVNSDIGAANGIDHYLPAVAVGQNGTVGACWYDRRRDPQNFLIDRECASSGDGGKSWDNTLITKRSFSPIIADDLLVNPVYMGDYDGVTADALGQSSGFRGAYGNNANGNPDVRISRRFGGSGDSGAQDDN
jgi:hypothetical protein